MNRVASRRTAGLIGGNATLTGAAVRPGGALASAKQCTRSVYTAQRRSSGNWTPGQYQKREYPYQKASEGDDKPSYAQEQPESKSVWASNFTLFGSKGMLMAKPNPAVFHREGDKFVAKEEGNLSITVMPAAAAPGGQTQQKKWGQQNGQQPAFSSGSKYDKANKSTLKVKANHVGSILAADPAAVYVEITGDAKDKLKLVIESDPEDNNKVNFNMQKGGYGNGSASGYPVQVTCSVGEFKALQVLLQASLPSLYGWQVLANPSLLPFFTEGHRGAVDALFDKPQPANNTQQQQQPKQEEPAAPKRPNWKAASQPTPPPPSAEDFFNEAPAQPAAAAPEAPKKRTYAKKTA